jgi:hypothetical protein
MEEVKLKLPALHATQREVYDDDARYKVLACGRRWGKDTLLDRVMLLAMLRGQNIALLLPRDIDADKVRERHRQILYDLEATKIIKWHKMPPRVTSTFNDGTIRYYTVKNHESIRGSSLDWFICNEAGEVSQMVDLGNVWEKTVRPALLDRRGRAYFAGTPKGLTTFYVIYQRGVDGIEGWRAWRYSTYENPFISKDEIEQMIQQERMSQKAVQQEIHAMFIETGGSVFSNLEQVCILQPREPREIPARSVVVGIDVGGGVDYTAMSVMSSATTPTAEYHLYRWRSAAVKKTLASIVEIINQWQPAEVVIETNAIGEYYYQELLVQLSGVPVTPFLTNSATKSEIIATLRYGLETKRLLLTNDETGMAELSSYEQKRRESGHVSYGAPKNLHDDTVMARALAYYRASAGVLGASLTRAAPMSFDAPRQSKNVYHLNDAFALDTLPERDRMNAWTRLPELRR